VQYEWYEIVGYGLLTAFLIWVMFQGLELLLDRILQYRIRKELDEQNRTAPVEEPKLPRRMPRRMPMQRGRDDDGA
jgi:hypothetical protein